MEAAYSSRKFSTAWGFSWMNSVRATTQPMVKVPSAPASSQAVLKSMAARTSLFCIITAVAAGTGSMARAASPETILACTSSLVSHWMSTSRSGSRPFWVRR